MINFWHAILSFLKSNFFIGFATLLAGAGVYLAYRLQKKDEKRNFARIILMEIRSAENSIDLVKNNVRKGNFEYVPILPENSWKKYNHLFVKNFDRDELDYINRFYNQCSKCEELLSESSKNFVYQLQQKASYIQEKLVGLAYELLDDKAYKEKRESFIKCVVSEPYQFSADYFKISVLQQLSEIKNVTISTCGEKLKKIAKFKT